MIETSIAVLIALLVGVAAFSIIYLLIAAEVFGREETMHPFVTIRAAEAGHLESPAFARRGLEPKVDIGSKYEPRLRTQFKPATGVYRGYNPAHDGDALNVQHAILGPGLAEIVPPKRPIVPDSVWWLIGGALLATLGWMALFVGPSVF